ncbi:MAG: mechanosensitive ion channel [Bacteroidota bacterium]|nr:mechanosensitive ion channel [Bacteroidota bacterium]
MSLNEILEFPIIDTSKVSITVYDIILVIIILVIAKLSLWIIKKVFKKKIYSNETYDIGKSHTIYQLIKYILWITVILLIFETVGVKLTFLLAGSAALLVGLGLGLQQIFRDVVSGIILLFERNIKVSDIVQLDQEIGKVKEIGFRTTKIESRDNIILIIPNSRFISENVINWSHIQKRTRFNVEVGVAYGSDVKLVKNVLLECAASHKLISKNPKPFVRFNNFGNSSLDFQLYFWTDKAFTVENIKSDLRFLINETFIKHSIQIPFPQVDAHIYNTNNPQTI